MWNGIVKTCEEGFQEVTKEEIVQKTSFPKLVSRLIQKIPVHCEEHLLETSGSNEPIPHGRYLVHIDPQKRFHIEIHIFSHNYIGEIHCHETWGVFWVISGGLFVEDFTFNDRTLKQVRSFVVQRGSVIGFHPPESDWHRVRTTDQQNNMPHTLVEQTISLHIYGAGYNQEYGKYLDQTNQLKESKRGAFKDNQLFLHRIKPKTTGSIQKDK